jgi:hypothetical protein
VDQERQASATACPATATSRQSRPRSCTAPPASLAATHRMSVPPLATHSEREATMTSLEGHRAASAACQQRQHGPHLNLAEHHSGAAARAAVASTARSGIQSQSPALSATGYPSTPVRPPVNAWGRVEGGGSVEALSPFRPTAPQSLWEAQGVCNTNHLEVGSFQSTCSHKDAGAPFYSLEPRPRSQGEACAAAAGFPATVGLREGEGGCASEGSRSFSSSCADTVAVVGERGWGGIAPFERYRCAPASLTSCLHGICCHQRCTESSVRPEFHFVV